MVCVAPHPLSLYSSLSISLTLTSLSFALGSPVHLFIPPTNMCGPGICVSPGSRGLVPFLSPRPPASQICLLNFQCGLSPCSPHLAECWGWVFHFIPWALQALHKAAALPRCVPVCMRVLAFTHQVLHPSPTARQLPGLRPPHTSF